MRYLRRLSSLLLVVVILFATFSITAAADTSSNIGISLTVSHRGYQSYKYAFPNVEPNYVINNILLDEEESTAFAYKVVDVNNDLIAKKGDNVKLTLSNVHILLNYNNKYVYAENLEQVRVLALYSDDTSEYITQDVEYSFKNPSGTFTANFVTNKNLIGVEFQGAYFYTDFYGNTNLSIEVSNDPYYTPNFSIEIGSEESGLLKGVIQWVKGIFDKITNFANDVAGGFSNVIGSLSEGFSNMVNGLIELPSKLWDLISEGLKNLFVPSEEYMTDYSNNWDSLLSSRFGAIYDVSTIITNFTERIQESDATNTIFMPSVSLEGVNIPFSFGGYDVQIVPSNFETIVEICKKIISIACTFLFINGLRKRYDEVMGVEK